MRLRITVEGATYEVDVEVIDEGNGTAPVAAPVAPAAPAAPVAPRPPAAPPAATPTASGDKICKSPLAGTILTVNVKPGDRVALNQVVVVMEAMKMETSIASPVEGVVTAVHVEKGATVRPGQLLVEFQ